MKPKLRFKEFTDDWEEKKLGEIAEIIIGMTYSPENLCNEGEGTLVLRSSNIKDNLLIFNDNKYIKNINIPEKKYIKDDDILLCSRNGSRELIGKSVLCKNIYKKMTFGAFMTLIRGKSNHYIAYEIQTINLKKYIHKNLGATINQITTSDLKKYKLYIPSLPEQEKIGTFLSLVDQRIEKAEKKVSLLKEEKKGWMQKLFQQEIRFKDEQGNDYPDWEEKKLGDILIEVIEKTTINNEYENLSSTNDGLFRQLDYFNNKVSSKDTTGYKILHKNQIVLSPQNLWLGNINYNKHFDIGIVSPSYKIFDIVHANKDYVSYLLKIPNMLYQYKMSSEQGASVVRRNLNIELFYDIKIQLPSLPEQEKIADFLSLLDQRIEKEERKVELLKEEKKGLLQNMFV